MPIHSFYRVLLVLFFVGIPLVSNNLAQEFTSAKTSGSEPLQSKSNKDLIHIGDVIDVDVIGSTEFDWRGTVSPEGFLSGLDFVGEPIYALCKTEADVAKTIAKGFEKLLRNPQVEVRILDKSGRAISYLYGAVRKPQRFSIQRVIRLNELIILSGGLDDKASGDIQIFRSSRMNCEDAVSNTNQGAESVSSQNDEPKIISLKIDDLIRGTPDSNPIIKNGDIVTIAEADPIYVIGGVASPRQIKARMKMTLTRAISMAGGLSKNSDSRNITIYRRAETQTGRIEVNYEKVLAKEIDDPILQKYDIIEVPEVGKTKRTTTPFVKVFENSTKPAELPLKLID